MRVTIKMIADELGISYSTVSRVLNEKQSSLVSSVTRERIMATSRRMGYRPSRIAQALQGKSTQLIGVVVPDTGDYFFESVIQGLRHTIDATGYELMVFLVPPDEITSRWQRLLQWDLDGVFVFDYLFYVDGLWAALTEHVGAIPPVVGLFSSNTQLKDYVTVDFRPAMLALLTHLLDQECRSLGYMAFPTSFTTGEQRYAVCAEETASRGLAQLDIPLPYGCQTLMEAGRVGLRSWLEQGSPLPNALFCQNDEIALGAYRALHELNIAVPDQILLAGCDDLPYVRYLETPLTTISLPVQEVCSRGWTILQNRIAEPSGPAMQIVLEAGFRRRDSSSRIAS